MDEGYMECAFLFWDLFINPRLFQGKRFKTVLYGTRFLKEVSTDHSNSRVVMSLSLFWMIITIILVTTVCTKLNTLMGTQ